MRISVDAAAQRDRRPCATCCARPSSTRGARRRATCARSSGSTAPRPGRIWRASWSSTPASGSSARARVLPRVLQAILDYRDAQPRRQLRTLEELSSIRGVTEDLLRNILYTGCTLRRASARRADAGRAGAAAGPPRDPLRPALGASWTMRLRIVPDEAAFDRFDPLASAEELTLVERLWDATGGDLEASEGRGRLAGAVRPRRRRAGGVAGPEVPDRHAAPPAAARGPLLRDAARPTGAAADLARPRRRRAAAGRDPDRRPGRGGAARPARRSGPASDGGGTATRGRARRRARDLDRPRSAGRRHRRGARRRACRRRRPRPGSRNHCDGGNFGLVAPGTPTNTVEGEPAAALDGDPEHWLRSARGTGDGRRGRAARWQSR